jgi:hypothetical protein
MNIISKPTGRPLGCEQTPASLLKIEVVRAQEVKRYDRLLGEYHYMGEAQPVGDFLRQVAVLDGKWVGLLAWGSACYALKDRDQYVGWTPTMRTERQKLVVQNRRFALLCGKGEHPNLASRILAGAVKALPEQWRAEFGYVPVLAETFTDVEAFAGTCYKAAGWEPLGLTQGFSRHRADFYVAHERPKKLWVKKLRQNALAVLCAQELPAEHRPGAHSCAHGVMPLKAAQIESLHERLCGVRDPRAGNRIFHIGALLSIAAMALLSGHRDVAQIHRFGQRLTQAQRKNLGLPRKKGTQFYRAPGYCAYYHLLRLLDPDVLAKALSEWLRAHAGELPGALALDGKMVRDVVGLVCLCDHETGVPHALARISEKQGEGDRCELKAAQRLIRALPDLAGKLVTADALHTQNETARAIVEQGGDFLIQIKANRKTMRTATESRMANAAPLLNSVKRPTAATPPGASA